MRSKLTVLMIIAGLCCMTARGYTQDEKKAEEANSTLSTETLFDNQASVSIGYQDIGLEGNPAKFQQYVTPPQGFFMDQFSVDGKQRSDKGPSFQLGLNRFEEQSYWNNGSFYSVDPIVSAMGRVSRYRFYFEPAPGATLPPLADRKVQDYSIKWSPLRAVQTVKVYRQSQGVNEPKINGDRIAFESRRVGVETAAKIKDTPVTFALWRDNFWPGVTLGQPNSRETHATLDWSPYANDRTSVDVGYSYNQVSQDFVASEATSRVLRVSALSYPVPGLLGQLRIDRIDLDQPLTRDGYTNSYNSAVLDLRYNVWSWKLRGGVDYRDVDHLNSVQSVVTNSKQKRYYLQAKKQFRDLVTFTARLDDMDLSNPPTADFLIDPRTLYFNDEQKLDLRADITPLKNVFLYAAFNRDRLNNTYRSANNNIQTWVTGGYVQLTQKISANLDFSRQRWDGSIPPTALDPTPLPRWFPDSRVTTASVQYAYDPRTLLLLSTTSSRSIGASDASVGTLGILQDRTYEATLNRTLNQDFAVSVTYRFRKYDDNTEAGMNFKEDQILISLKANL